MLHLALALQRAEGLGAPGFGRYVQGWRYSTACVGGENCDMHSQLKDAVGAAMKAPMSRWSGMWTRRLP